MSNDPNTRPEICRGRIDWFMNRMSEADCTHFVSGRRTLGHPRGEKSLDILMEAALLLDSIR